MKKELLWMPGKFVKVGKLHNFHYISIIKDLEKKLECQPTSLGIDMRDVPKMDPLVCEEITSHIQKYQDSQYTPNLEEIKLYQNMAGPSKALKELFYSLNDNALYYDYKITVI